MPTTTSDRGTLPQIGKPVTFRTLLDLGSPISTLHQQAAPKKDTMLSSLGASTIPHMITIYRWTSSTGFVLNIWMHGMRGKKQSKILYGSGRHHNRSFRRHHAITLVLIAFLLPLIVSIIMIGITYICIERTRKSVFYDPGGKKKDIARV